MRAIITRESNKAVRFHTGWVIRDRAVSLGTQPMTAVALKRTSAAGEARSRALDGGDVEVDKIINPPPDNMRQLHESKP